MAGSTRTLKVEILGDGTSAKAAMAETGAEGEAMGGKLSSALSSAMGMLGLPFTGSLNKVGAVLDETSGKSRSFGQAVSDAGKTVLTAGAVGFVAAAGEAVHLAMSYDQATGKIAASSGISTAAAKKIGDAFLSTAGTVTFKAQDIATAFAGVAGQLKATEGHALNSSQAMEVMKAAMDGAEATTGDLGSTTNALASVMQAYGLKTGQASKAMDTLYNISRMTNTPIDGLTTILDRLKGRLGTLAPTLQDVGTLMAFPAVAAQGSRGAMIVNTALQTLIGGSKATKAELTSLGINIFDASGKFVGMKSVIAQVGPALAGMSDQQKAAAEKTLFGASAAQLMGSVMSGGVSAYDKAAKAVGKTGTAQDAAQKSTDNLKGQMEKLGAGTTDLGTKFGEVLVPKIVMVAKAVTSVISWFEKHKTVARELGDVIAALAAGAVAKYVVGVGAKMVKATTQAMKSIGDLAKKFITSTPEIVASQEEVAVSSEATGVAMDSAFGPIGLIIAAVVLVGVLLMTHWKEVEKVAVEVWGKIEAFFKRWWPEILGIFTMGIGLVVGLLVKHWSTVTKDVSEAWSAISNFFKKWWPELLAVFTMGISVVVGMLVQHWSTITNDVHAAWSAIINFFTGIPGKIMSALDSLGRLMQSLMSDAWHLVLDAVNVGWEVVKFQLITIPEKAIQALASLGGLLLGWITEAWSHVLSGLQSAWNATWAWLTFIPSKIVQALGNLGGLLVQGGRDVVQGLINGISGAWGAVWDFIKGKLGGLVSSVLGFFGIHSPSLLFAGIGRNLMEGMAVGIGDGANSTMEAMSKATASITGGGQLGPMGTATASSSNLVSPSTSASSPAAPAPAASSTAAPNIYVDVETNADPHRIGSEVGWALRTH